MLYSEFIENTGCKDNPQNYQLYKNLEVMYMHSDLPKATIYEYGRKLADNSKSQKEIEIETRVKAEIETYLTYAKDCLAEAAKYQSYIDFCQNTKEEIKEYRASVKFWKEEAAKQKRHAKAIRQLFGM